MTFTVIDNVTGAAVRTFEHERDAEHLCRGLNVQHGPGGRYGIRHAGHNAVDLRTAWMTLNSTRDRFTDQRERAAFDPPRNGS